MNERQCAIVGEAGSTQDAGIPMLYSMKRRGLLIGVMLVLSLGGHGAPADEGLDVITYDPAIFGPDNPLEELVADSDIQLVQGQYLPAPRLEIVKSTYKMMLYTGSHLLKTYRIQLGSEPLAAKTHHKDGRTPEGSYTICAHNPNSKFYRSLQLNYPSEEDIRRGLETKLISNAKAEELRAALAAGRCAPADTKLGGDIFIHGQHPTITSELAAAGAGFSLRQDLEPGDLDPAALHSWHNWTAGCIGMTNPDIRELYRFLPDGTPVDIHK